MLDTSEKARLFVVGPLIKEHTKIAYSQRSDCIPCARATAPRPRPFSSWPLYLA
jgi:hypothetical protein